MSEQAFFRVENLQKRFGGLAAIDGLSFELKEGAIHGLIGPNGAGKTTVFNVITGFYKPTAGKIYYQGESIGGLQPHQVAAKGLVRTFQETTLFREFTTFENALMGCYLHTKTSMLSALFGTQRASEQASDAKTLEVLEFLGLADRKDEPASNLPHGLQRALGVAVALTAEPKLLLLDEPFAGMNPEETRNMMELILKVRESGITILLVEHDMQAVMGLCERITVVSFGQLLSEGAPDEIKNNKDVVEAYLGSGLNAA